ncbi:MAG TPA: nucleotidyltransferase domain-containing protein [Spirochaetia bacterium]|nr:nucleotidyltransferase domain-containing protein [Spirochaetia bacterium]
MPFDTSLRDQAVRRERAEREAARIAALEATRDALSGLRDEFSLQSAIIFGSVIHPDGFRRDSDIDIALDSPPVEEFRLAGRLSRLIGREVHIVPLDGSAVAERARREGVEWKPTS